jgi:hypothetical protein
MIAARLNIDAAVGYSGGQIAAFALEKSLTHLH